MRFLKTIQSQILGRIFIVLLVYSTINLLGTIIAIKLAPLLGVL